MKYILKMRELMRIVAEAYAGGFKGRNGTVDVLKNPSRPELRSLTEHESVRMFLLGDDVLAWKTDDALHNEVMIWAGEELHLSNEVIPIVLYYSGNAADCMVTDFAKRTQWYHNKSTAAVIRNNRYLRAIFSDISVSYFDEDIVGDWTKMK
jgi:hypothetical protein